jgi:hypothetical protein
MKIADSIKEQLEAGNYKRSFQIKLDGVVIDESVMPPRIDHCILRKEFYQK